MIIEAIGILATIFIVIAFMLDGELKIRVVDLIGASLFILYGMLVKSFSVVLLNFILVGVQTYKIIKMKHEVKETENEQFEAK